MKHTKQPEDSDDDGLFHLFWRYRNHSESGSFLVLVSLMQLHEDLCMLVSSPAPPSLFSHLFWLSPGVIEAWTLP